MTTEVDKEYAAFLSIDKVVEFYNLFHKDEANDYYFIQYLSTVLDYIERDSKGCLTELGRMSLAVNIMPIYQKLAGQVESEKVTQKELVKFCLYMLNSYATCVLYKGMVEVYKEHPLNFSELHPLPYYILDDMLKIEDRVFGLVDKFKKILDHYSQSLEGKYRSIFNEEKHKGFVKQIFSFQVIGSAGKFMPNELKNAKEMT